jgi:phage shock protein E
LVTCPTVFRTVPDGIGAVIGDHSSNPHPDPFPVMPSFQNKPVDFVIDVRSHVEYWLGHLGGAECIPVQKIAEAVRARAEIKPDSRILVYCASGARSATAAATLKSLGYRRVIDGGGMAQARNAFVP